MNLWSFAPKHHASNVSVLSSSFINREKKRITSKGLARTTIFKHSFFSSHIHLLFVSYTTTSDMKKFETIFQVLLKCLRLLVIFQAAKWKQNLVTSRLEINNNFSRIAYNELLFLPFSIMWCLLSMWRCWQLISQYHRLTKKKTINSLSKFRYTDKSNHKYVFELFWYEL